MPELPEVENVRRELAPYLAGERIERIEFTDPRNLKRISAATFKENLRGDRILNVSRRAKYLIFKLKSDKTLVIHLGMTGNLLFKPDKFVKAIFYLSHHKKIYFSDKRLFGKIWLYSNFPEFDLGPEPLSKNFKPGEFKTRLKKHKIPIKLLLLNQKFISGLGNIYACEALFRAGINPQTPAPQIDQRQAGKLFQSIQQVLKEAIKAGGTSAQDFLGVDGQGGSFQKLLRVYAREGEPCLKCSTPIKRIVLGQRGTYFCPGCQA